VIFCVPGLSRGGAFAQENPEMIYELGEVVVSAKREVGVETIGTIRTISAPELQASGARTLDEAIELVPGLHIRVGAAGTPRVDIRGFWTRHVQLLLDGIPINDTYDGQFDPTTIPVENIAKIKLTTGGGSVLYGPGGNGGVINIITRRGRAGFHGSVALEAGEGKANKGTFTVSRSIPKWTFFVSGRPYARDGYPLADGFSATRAEDGGQRENSDLKRQNLFASATYARSASTRIGLTFNGIQGENGVPSVTNYDKNDPFAQKAKFDRVDDLDGYGMQAAFSHALDNRSTLRGWAYLNHLEMEENRYDDATYGTQSKKGARRTRSAAQVSGISLQVRRSVQEIGAATLGLTAENQGWDASGFQIGNKDERSDFGAEQELRVYSTALQYETWPAPGVGLALGYAHHFQEKEGGSLESDFSFLIGAWYNLSERTQVKASFARKIRFPSIRQLYDGESGDPGLNAERTWHYELGLEQRFPAGVLVSATGFAIDAQDFIEKDETKLYRNFQELRFKGVELAAEKRFVGRLSLRGAYAYLGTEDRSPDSEREELQHRPKHKFSLEGTHRFGFGLVPHVSFMRVAGQYFYDSDGKLPLEKKALDDYTLVDVKLKQSLLSGRVEIYVGADNLFDENYEQSYGLPQPGRTVYGGFRFPF